MIGPKTIRAKLTLTAVAVIAGLLCIVGLGVDLVAGKTLMMSVDSQLRHTADGIVTRHREFHARDRANGGPPGPFQPPPKERFSALDPRFVRVAPDSTVPPSKAQPFDGAAVAAAEKGTESTKTTTYEDEPIRLLTVPLRSRGRIEAVVQIPYPLADVDAALGTLRTILVTLIPIGGLLSALAAMFLIDRVLRPLYRIASTADAIGSQTHGERISVVGRDEFAFLGRTLNRMLDRLEAAIEAEQATSKELDASLQRQRRFTGDASHELKTPVAVVKANTSMLLQMSTLQPEDAECVKDIDAAADRMDRMVRALMVLAKAESSFPAAVRKPCDLNAVVEAAVREAQPGPAEVSILPCPEAPKVSGVCDEPARMIRNLVDNARRHAAATSISVTVREAAGGAEIEVRDDGIGIAPEHLPHIFDRFYRVDASRSTETGGTGLGLAICKGVAEGHGGTIRVESTVGQGTTFTVFLPESSALEGECPHEQ